MEAILDVRSAAIAWAEGALKDGETIRKFEKVLRQQYVIETCESGSPSRHVWNFNDWCAPRRRDQSGRR